MAYIAGFLDGDGSILLQIVKQRQYKYGFTIRVSVCFYQKKTRYWFLLWVKKKLRHGRVHLRGDGMAQYTLTGFSLVQSVVQALLPYLQIKKPLAKLCLKVIESYDRATTKADFLEVCFLIDKAAKFTDSKNRKYTGAIVQQFFDSPVETFPQSAHVLHAVPTVPNAVTNAANTANAGNTTNESTESTED